MDKYILIILLLLDYGGGGGGGSGGSGPSGQKSAASGTYATGGGGGGVYSIDLPGNGGSGVVVVRYQIGAEESGTAKATGGAISFYPSRTIHTFTSSGDF